MLLWIGLSSAFAQGSKTDISHGVRLLERTVATGVPGQPEIRLFLRLPEGHTSENPTARGVLAFCTWEGESDSIRKKLASETDSLVQYAKTRGLALIAWNTATLWKTGRSYNQVDRQERQKQDADFDKVARAWKSGVSKLCREQSLPEDGFLLYGISRGAHWSGRLALRAPGKFLAVHLHMANSYDKPQGSGGQALWMVCSGDLDFGRDNAIRFYQECRRKEFPIMLKIINGLGHADHAENTKMRAAFFDYALQVKERATTSRKTPAQIMREDIAAARLTGDLLSQEVYRGDESSKIPEAQRMPLVSEALARVWGHLRE